MIWVVSFVLHEFKNVVDVAIHVAFIYFVWYRSCRSTTGRYQIWRQRQSYFSCIVPHFALIQQSTNHSHVMAFILPASCGSVCVCLCAFFLLSLNSLCHFSSTHIFYYNFTVVFSFCKRHMSVSASVMLLFVEIFHFARISFISIDFSFVSFFSLSSWVCFRSFFSFNFWLPSWLCFSDCVSLKILAKLFSDI